MRALFLGLAGLVALAIGVWELDGRGPINPALGPATAAAQDIAAKTGAVYVSLRVITAALSTAQEIQLSASIGAQASLQPLKVLEPVDDTVERVAGVVFAVAVGATLATMGFAPVAALGLCLLGLGCLLRLADDRLFAISGMAAAAGYAMRLGAVLGLILPLGFAGGVALGERITAPQWEAALATLSDIAGEAGLLIGAGGDTLPALDPATADDAGLFSRIGRQFQAAGEGMGEAVASVARYRDAAVVLMSQADDLFAATLTIIGVFALRILILPALLLWGAVALMRRSAGVAQTGPAAHATHPP